MEYLTSRSFFRARKCLRYGWLGLNHREDSLFGASVQRRVYNKLNHILRLTLGTGYVVVGTERFAAAELTQKAALTNDYNVIYAPVFFANNCVARIDAMRQTQDGWEVILIKAALRMTSPMVNEMAFAVMVAQAAGYAITKVTIKTISRDYRLGMAEEAVFTDRDVTKEVERRIGSFQDSIIPIYQSLQTESESVWHLGCRNCQYLSDCHPIEHSVLELPDLSTSQFSQLSQFGWYQISDIPEDFPLTTRQRIVREAVLTGQPVVHPSLIEVLANITWPAYYLDFEAVNPPLPLADNHAPFAQLPFQFSLHICSGPDEVVHHEEFLAEADMSQDFVRSCCEALLEVIGTKGSIISYGNFEQHQLQKFSEWYPEYREELTAAIARLVDLEAIIKQNFYHPEFAGKTSIKKTLPALVPELAYDDLSISEGMSAAAAFMLLLVDEVPAAEVEQMRQDLLDYCARDSLAMVKLHAQLLRYT